ncbi:MAG: glycosyltransferase family 4 protein [Acetatifactor sp.]|nr:glycosyltransferase family 4 protein [Acetatifactor sp.]
MDKICFFSGDITRNGGTERVSAIIANALARQGNYQILFLSLVEQAREPFFSLEDGIERHVLGDRWISPGPGYLRVIPRLRRFLKQNDINVIIDIDIVLDILSIPAAKGLPTRIISWEHFNYKYEMTSLYRRYILRYCVKRTDYFVTLTEVDMRAYMEKLGRREAISFIYNPVPEFTCAEDVEKEKWLISVGHLVSVKGIDHLAEVAALVLKRHPDWKWMVVGDGEEREFLEKFIERNQLEDQLILTGSVKDVSSYLRKSQIYVMTSRSEGLPMCLLEAKMFRLPSVSFDIYTGPNEIIEDSVNGYLVDAFDCKAMAQKLERLMENDVLRKQFSEHAQDNLENFQLKSILNKWNMVLDKVLH